MDTLDYLDASQPKRERQNQPPASDSQPPYALVVFGNDPRQKETEQLGVLAPRSV